MSNPKRISKQILNKTLHIFIMIYCFFLKSLHFFFFRVSRADEAIPSIKLYYCDISKSSATICAAFSTYLLPLFFFFFFISQAQLTLFQPLSPLVLYLPCFLHYRLSRGLFSLLPSLIHFISSSFFFSSLLNNTFPLKNILPLNSLEINKLVA